MQGRFLYKVGGYCFSLGDVGGGAGCSSAMLARSHQGEQFYVAGPRVKPTSFHSALMDSPVLATRSCLCTGWIVGEKWNNLNVDSAETNNIHPSSEPATPLLVTLMTLPYTKWYITPSMHEPHIALPWSLQCMNNT